MINSKNDPDYILEEYKGYTIASHRNNVIGKDIDNVIIVYKSEDFPNYGFIVGLDDSKMSGRRKSVPNNIDDAKSYVDWMVKHIEQALKKHISTHNPQTIKEVAEKILTEVKMKMPQSKASQFPNMQQRKGRKM